MSRNRRLVVLAMYLTTALILSYLESLVPLPIPIPGIKLGLANIATVVCLYTFGLPLTLLLVASWVFLAGFLFGSMSSILYALSGGLVSALIMGLLSMANKKEQRLSLMAISVAGAIAHNLGQLIVATLVIGNLKLLLYYLPFLVLLAIPTGLVVGMAAQLLIGALKHQGLLP